MVLFLTGTKLLERNLCTEEALCFRGKLLVNIGPIAAEFTFEILGVGDVFVTLTLDSSRCEYNYNPFLVQLVPTLVRAHMHSIANELYRL